MIDEYHIYIPTRGRVGKINTLRALSKKLLDITTIVVECEEKYLHKDLPCKFWVIDRPTTNLGDTCQYIIDNTEYKYVSILDDDLRWCKRIEKSLRQPLELQSEFSTELFALQEKWLREGYVHCGVSRRDGNNRNKEGFKIIDRMTGVLSYNVEEVRKLKIRWNRVPLKTDLDSTLQLLRLGYPNIVDYMHAASQEGESNQKGGTATYRTETLNDWVCEELERLHPDFVNIVLKFTHASWTNVFNGIRNDVIIQWKKAYEEGTLIRKGATV